MYCERNTEWWVTKTNHPPLSIHTHMEELQKPHTRSQCYNQIWTYYPGTTLVTGTYWTPEIIFKNISFRLKNCHDRKEHRTPDDMDTDYFKVKVSLNVLKLCFCHILSLDNTYYERSRKHLSSRTSLRGGEGYVHDVRLQLEEMR